MTTEVYDQLADVRVIEAAKRALIAARMVPLDYARCVAHQLSPDTLEGWCCPEGDVHLRPYDERFEHIATHVLRAAADALAHIAHLHGIGAEEYSAMVLTSENRGDHAAEVRVALHVEHDTTVAELCTEAGRAVGRWVVGISEPRRMADADVVEVRMVVEQPDTDAPVAPVVVADPGLAEVFGEQVLPSEQVVPTPPTFD